MIPPTLENVEASIGSPPVIIELFPPNFVSGELLNSLSLTCTSSGNPQPTTTWTKIGKDNSIVGFGDTLLFPQLNLTERGFYQCTARNWRGSVSSQIIHVNISGVCVCLCVCVRVCVCNCLMWLMYIYVHCIYTSSKIQ